MQETTFQLKLSDELTIYSVSELKEQLLTQLGQYDAIELDLSQVTELDGAGIQLLIAVKLESKRLGKSLAFHKHSQSIVAVFELLGLSSWFGDPLLIKNATI